MALFLITAPSGAGKTTVAQKLQKMGYWDECISHTTRPMREGEVNGKTYYYVTVEEFKELHDTKQLAERVVYDGNFYGIAKTEIERVMRKDKHVFIIVDNDGYKQVKEQYPDAVGIFLYASKEECMTNMLIRGDSLEKANKRIALYDDEMKNRNQYDYVIRNVRDKFDYTCMIIRNIIVQYNKDNKGR